MGEIGYKKIAYLLNAKHKEVLHPAFQIVDQKKISKHFKQSFVQQCQGNYDLELPIS